MTWCSSVCSNLRFASKKKKVMAEMSYNDSSTVPPPLPLQQHLSITVSFSAVRVGERKDDFFHRETRQAQQLGIQYTMGMYINIAILIINMFVIAFVLFAATVS